MPPPNKKRKVVQADRVEEISFDPAARQEYLTGFRKRKQQRIQNARDAAVKREKEEKVRERKQLRDQRKVELEKHVAEVNAELRKQNPDLESDEEDEDEWEGIGNEDEETEKVAPDDIAQDEEYVDEDKYTTVTVEAMGEDDEDKEDNQYRGDGAKSGDPQGDKGKRLNGKTKLPNGKAKPKKQKFRYESKAERNADRQKQKAKNHAAKMRRTGKS